MRPGTTELLIILFIVLLLFGSRKLPDLTSSVVKSIREFRKASDEADTPRDDDRRDDPNREG